MDGIKIMILMTDVWYKVAPTTMGTPFVWFTAAAFEIRGAGSAQKGLGSHYISDFYRIKRVYVKRPSLEFKKTRNPKSKRKNGS